MFFALAPSRHTSPLHTHASARVTSEECVVWCLDKKYYALLEVENPQLCIVVQHVLLKSMSMVRKLH